MCAVYVQPSDLPAQPSTTPATQPSSSSSTSSYAGQRAGPGRGRGSNSSRRGGATGSTSSSYTPRSTAAEMADVELAKQVSEADFSNLQLYRLWASQPPASASFKLDGSLIIAFVWRGQLFTCTRRRMTSEQVCILHLVDWRHTFGQCTLLYQPLVTKDRLLGRAARTVA